MENTVVFASLVCNNLTEIKIPQSQLYRFCQGLVFDILFERFNLFTNHESQFLSIPDHAHKQTYQLIDEIRTLSSLWLLNFLVHVEFPFGKSLLLTCSSDGCISLCHVTSLSSFLTNCS